MCSLETRPHLAQFPHAADFTGSVGHPFVRRVTVWIDGCAHIVFNRYNRWLDIPVDRALVRQDACEVMARGQRTASVIGRFFFIGMPDLGNGCACPTASRHRP